MRRAACVLGISHATGELIYLAATSTLPFLNPAATNSENLLYFFGAVFLFVRVRSPASSVSFFSAP